MGGPGAQEDLASKLESMRSAIEEVNRQFQDPEKTTVGRRNNCIALYLHVHKCDVHPTLNSLSAFASPSFSRCMRLSA